MPPAALVPLLPEGLPVRRLVAGPSWQVAAAPDAALAAVDAEAQTWFREPARAPGAVRFRSGHNRLVGRGPYWFFFWVEPHAAGARVRSAVAVRSWFDASVDEDGSARFAASLLLRAAARRLPAAAGRIEGTVPEDPLARSQRRILLVFVVVFVLLLLLGRLIAS